MSAFLQGFARSLVDRLLAGDLIEIRPGGEEAVAAFLAEALGGGGIGRQLISTVSAALVACPEVDELFADDDDLKRVIEGLNR